MLAIKKINNTRDFKHRIDGILTYSPLALPVSRLVSPLEEKDRLPGALHIGYEAPAKYV
jgi:hypothetical protein